MEQAHMALTPAELLEKALNGQSLDGDDVGEVKHQTSSDGAAGADGEAVDAANAQAAAAQQQDGTAVQAQATGDEPAGAPIASKSGAYTIPYEKLEEARTRAKSLEGENETLRAQIAELSTKQQANLERAEEKAKDRADAGQKQTAADQNLDAAKAAIGAGADVSLFGDFSEEALAKGIAALVSQDREAMRAELKAEMRVELEREFAPVKAKQAAEASSSHVGAIEAKHPDVYEIAQSVEFDAWRKSLPSYARDAVDAVLNPETGGSAAQVIEIFDTFKAQTGKAAAPGAKDAGKAPEVQRRVPHSLSEAAGEQHQDLTQQVMASAGTNPAALIERMQDMTPEQVDRLLNTI
jgi:rRNA maturation endonuclease Nob1